jgi:hypothetical protein
MTGMGTPHTPQTLADKVAVLGIEKEYFQSTIELCVKLRLVEISGHVTTDVTDHAVPASPRRHHDVTPASPQRHPSVTTTSIDTDRTDIQTAAESVTPASPQRHPGDAGNAAAAVFEKESGEGPMLSEVVHELQDCGVDDNTASELTGQYGLPQILAAIKLVRSRGDSVRNVAGLVIAALKGDYDTAEPESAFEAKKKAEAEARADRKQEERQAEKKRIATHQEHLEIMAALPPDQFERLKALSHKAMPKGVASKVHPEDGDPMEHAVWRSFMWFEYEKAHSSPESGDMLAGTQ